ncbi:MAG: hypothetical protein ACLFOA_07505 [Desulfohalobiaceae bacterium]
MITLDPSEFPKKGHCLLDCQLYMPEHWFDAGYQDLGRENLKLYELRELAQSKDLPWRKVSLGEGAKGPLLADMACVRVYPSRDGLLCDQPVWLVIRIHEDGKLKYAFSNAPETMTFDELFQASCMRYPIRAMF